MSEGDMSRSLYLIACMVLAAVQVVHVWKKQVLPARRLVLEHAVLDHVFGKRHHAGRRGGEGDGVWVGDDRQDLRGGKLALLASDEKVGGGRLVGIENVDGFGKAAISRLIQHWMKGHAT